MRIFWIGCRDSGNVLKPMVTILRGLKNVLWGNQFYEIDVETLMVP
jgi:hypothetical protein